MSTPNFYTQKDFNLYIQAFEPMSLEEYKAEEFHYDDYLFPQYLEAEDEEDEEYILEKSYNHAMELWSEDFYTEIFDGNDGFKKTMEDFNNTLTFYKLKFKSGYYDGIQIYVEEINENPHDLDNEDCKYYYDMCRSQAIKKHDAEVKKINKWMDKVAVEYGWKKLICLGVASNGEAFYQYAN